MDSKLKAITKGSQIIDQIFWELFKTLKTRSALTELDLARQIKTLAKKMGGQGMAFKPIVAFGRGSSEIHHWATKTKIGNNNFLMFDYGVKVNGYCSDFTRTVFLGRPNKLQEKIYKITLRAQLAAIDKIKIGRAGDEVDFAARHPINLSGYGKRFAHGTGHGVTKKIHDLPNFKPNSGDILKKGDIVTVEPGIYLPNRFGVRIEDMILVDSKPKIFSKIPKDFKSMII